jgi:hypothetical protein
MSTIDGGHLAGTPSPRQSGDTGRIQREGIASSYMTRVLRLTLLAPDIVEAILDGRQGPEVTLARVLEPCPVEWQAQSALFV